MADELAADEGIVDMPAPAEANATALALALAAADGPGMSPATDFLVASHALIGDQRHHLREQMKHMHEQQRHMRLRHFEHIVAITIKLITVAFAALILGGLVALAWGAARDRSTVIEPFAVPPAYAQRGLTGPVLANQLLDQLATIDANVHSVRLATASRSGLGEDVKLEIPETGVSLGELERAFRKWFGHETHVTGELYEKPDGISLTARSPGAAHRVTGTPASLEPMIRTLAEKLYRDAQPYRFAVYLAGVGRRPEALEVARDLAENGPSDERVWAFIELANLADDSGDKAACVAHASDAIASDPRSYTALVLRAQCHLALSHPGEALADARRGAALLAASDGTTSSESRAFLRTAGAARMAAQLGDGTGADRALAEVAAGPNFSGLKVMIAPMLASDALLRHDAAAARRIGATRQVDGPVLVFLGQLPLAALLAADAGRWSEAAAILQATIAQAAGPVPAAYRERTVRPALAMALARAGRLDEAAAQAAALPADCYDCLRARGVIAAQRRDQATAYRWFAAATAQSPAIPAAHVDWAAAALSLGDTAAALTQARAAAAAGPDCPDAHAVLGEALARAGQPAEAARAFGTAAMLAPRWAHVQSRSADALAAAGEPQAAADHRAAAQRIAHDTIV